MCSRIEGRFVPLELWEWRVQDHDLETHLHTLLLLLLLFVFPDWSCAPRYSGLGLMVLTPYQWAYLLSALVSLSKC